MPRRGQISIEKLNSLFKAISQLDSDKRDYRISKAEYEIIKDKHSITKELVGNRKFDSWESFKVAFIDNQNQYNIFWKQAQGGALYLDEIVLTEDMGLEIASKIIDKMDSKDNPKDLFVDCLKDYISEMMNYIQNNTHFVTLTEFREGFKSCEKKNYSLKFKQGRNSTKFIKTLNAYTYLNKEGSQDEFQFGQEIEKRIEAEIGIEIKHIQTERTGGKYQNYDFTGFKRKTTPFSDSIDIYSFELKPSNQIEYISDAISQAVNYRVTSNFVYIIIPMFDKKLFHDEARFDTFYELCKSNKIGIITVEMDTAKHIIKDLYEVLAPQRNEIMEYNLLESIMLEKKMEICPLCRRIVINDEERKGCGWLSSKDSKCMKRVFEDRLTM